MNVVVLIGDVVKSRSISHRAKFQAHLQELLTAMSRDNRDLLSPYTITLGDEFQAVYRTGEHLFRDIFQILGAVFPHRIRFAIAIGRLDTPINPRQAIGMDGPAFHLCREGITQLKQKDSFFQLNSVTGGWELANGALALISHEIKSWNRNRMLIMARLLAEVSPRTIAEELHISSVAVYKNIRAGALVTIHNILQEITREINRQVRTP